MGKKKCEYCERIKDVNDFRWLRIGYSLQKNCKDCQDEIGRIKRYLMEDPPKKKMSAVDIAWEAMMKKHRK